MVLGPGRKWRYRGENNEKLKAKKASWLIFLRRLWHKGEREKWGGEKSNVRMRPRLIPPSPDHKRQTHSPDASEMPCSSPGSILTAKYLPLFGRTGASFLPFTHFVSEAWSQAWEVRGNSWKGYRWHYYCQILTNSFDLTRFQYT